MKRTKFIRAIEYPAYFIGLMWAVHFIQFLPFVDLRHFGVLPRRIEGLSGIFFSPLLHGSFGHLMSNTIPFGVLGVMIFYFYPRVAWRSLMSIYIFSGISLWLLGNMFTMQNSFHIGASGVVYGMVSFVFWTGIFRKNLKSIGLALIVLFYYGGLFMGIMPGQEGISWEGHLYGAFVGIFVAYWFKDEIENDEQPKVYSWENEPDSDTPFLPGDVFEKTKEQRRQEREQNSGNDWFSNYT